VRAAAAAGCSTRRPRERWPRRKAFGRGSGPGAVRVRWLGAQMGRGWPGIRLGTRLCQSSQSAHKQRPTERLRGSCVPVCGSCQTHKVPQCLCGFGEKFCHWLDCLPLHNTHAAARPTPRLHESVFIFSVCRPGPGRHCRPGPVGVG
jgi:hypothetical protein